MFKKIKIYMSENNKKILWIGSLAIIIFIVTGLATFNELKKQNNQLSAVLKGEQMNGKSSDHDGPDGCDLSGLTCYAKETTVGVGQYAHFNVEGYFNSSHDYPGNGIPSSCYKQNIRFTWKNLSIGVEDGINLSVVASTYAGTAKEVRCPNVKIDPGIGGGGDSTDPEINRCAIIFVNGVWADMPTNPSRPLFSTKAIERIIDPSFVYTDKNISGIGEKYNAVTVRGLMPKNVSLESSNVSEYISNIKSQHEAWAELGNKVLISGYSLGGVATFNYIKNYNIQNASMLLYDPPHGWYYRPIKPCTFDGLPAAGNNWPNGGAVCWAEWNYISNFITENWTNGSTKPKDNGSDCSQPELSHTQYLCTPSVLDKMPEWVESNCQHIYFPKLYQD